MVRSADRLRRQGDTLYRARDFATAVARYREAVATNSDLAEAWYGLGCSRLAQGAFGDGVDALRRATALRPDSERARCSLAETLFKTGETDQALAEFATAAAGTDPEVRAVALANMAVIAPGCASLDNAGILATRQVWATLAGQDIQPLTPAPAEPGRKLRIGYISAFFGARNWMKFVFGVINAHDRDRFEIHLLSDGDDPCSESGYADHGEDRVWRIKGMPNADLARHIVAAGIDVVVELNGYSDQNRLLLFRHRAARWQISWMGMYGTTGLPETDCVVGDDAVIPPAEEKFCCERVVRVPGSYLAFTVPYAVPDVAPPPCLGSPGLTFGCLASAYKLTDPTIAAYARILHKAPTSRLLLCNRTLKAASNRNALLGRFARHGIDPMRLVLVEGAEHTEFLRMYDRVDIALDTFPYSGGTTTAEALWQGVPVLSFNGDRWAARTSCSILLAAGLEAWVAAAEAGFVEAAVGWATDPAFLGRLAALRSGLRARLAGSAACDTAGLCRSLEALYSLAPAAGRVTQI